MLWAKKVLILLGDIVALYLALVLTLFIRYYPDHFSVSFKDHLGPFSLIFLLWILVFYLGNLYRPHMFRNRAALMSTLAIAVLVALLGSIITFYLFGAFFELTPKTNLLIFSAAFFLIGYFLRHATLNIFASGAIPIVVLGNTPLVEQAINFLGSNPHSGYRVRAWSKTLTEKTLEEITSGDKLKRVELAVIAESHLTKEVAGTIVQKLLPKEIAIISFWDFYEMLFEKIPLEELEEKWFIENITMRRPFYDRVKRALDFILSLVLTLILFIPGVLIALLIGATSSGSAIFSQERTGKNGKIFKVYKFRTMREEKGGPLWTEANDSRITWLGKILRFTHLDEIPQLINILNGDISFTGPRPERVELADQYRALPYYDMRHVVKPGLTGWAQINFKPSASLEEAQEKLRYDIFYVKNRSFWLDLRIILKTIKYVFTSYYAP